MAYRLRGYRIFECGGCGFLFNADFQEDAASKTFSREYFMVHHRAGFEPQLADYRNDLSLPFYERRLTALEARLGHGRRLLDVGAGFGSFLRLARERGWQVEGVEISGFAVEHVRKAHGIEIFQGNLTDYPAADESFDVVTFWDSVEHIGRPLQNLQKAYRLLRPGGLALLTTDIFDCLIADVANMIYRLSLGRIFYPVQRIYIDRNYSFFTEESFRRLLAQIGFREILVEKMEHPLGKIEVSLLERWVLRAFYLAAAVTGRQAQMTVIVQKP